MPAFGGAEPVVLEHPLPPSFHLDQPVPHETLLVPIAGPPGRDGTDGVDGAPGDGTAIDVDPVLLFENALA